MPISTADLIEAGRDEAWVVRRRVRQLIRQFAHRAVRLALLDGRLRRPTACERCGEVPAPSGTTPLARTHKIDAHHPDYAEPLRVEWLCCRCHRVEHGGPRVGKLRGEYQPVAS